MKTLIKNGRIITAVDDYRADILIEDEQVSLIGKTLEMKADKVIDFFYLQRYAEVMI